MPVATLFIHLSVFLGPTMSIKVRWKRFLISHHFPSTVLDRLRFFLHCQRTESRCIKLKFVFNELNEIAVHYCANVSVSTDHNVFAEIMHGYVCNLHKLKLFKIKKKLYKIFYRFYTNKKILTSRFTWF